MGAVCNPNSDQMNLIGSKIKSNGAWRVILFSNKEKTKYETSECDSFYYNNSTGIATFKNMVRIGSDSQCLSLQSIASLSILYST